MQATNFLQECQSPLYHELICRLVWNHNGQCHPRNRFPSNEASHSLSWFVLMPHEHEIEMYLRQHPLVLSNLVRCILRFSVNTNPAPASVRQMREFVLLHFSCRWFDRVHHPSRLPLFNGLLIRLVLQRAWKLLIAIHPRTHDCHSLTWSYSAPAAQGGTGTGLMKTGLGFSR